jgi:20S proteasome subunit beta 6
MAAMFSQNPLMNGPNYSFNDTPRVNAPEGAREHRFDPYGPHHPSRARVEYFCLV